MPVTQILVRKYNIRYNLGNTIPEKIDDYYMLKEVLSRRFKKIQDSEKYVLPDLIIVDGGRGQFNIAKEILNKNKLKSIYLIGVSKGKNRNAGREIIHLNDKNINLKPNDPLLFFIQRIRDEAHRFAITAHRKRRDIFTKESIFNELPGIGVKRKKLLLKHFGTVEKMKNASKEELKSVKDVPITILNQVYDFFHSQ